MADDITPQEAVEESRQALERARRLDLVVADTMSRLRKLNVENGFAEKMRRAYAGGET